MVTKAIVRYNFTVIQKLFVSTALTGVGGAHPKTSTEKSGKPRVDTAFALFTQEVPDPGH